MPKVSVLTPIYNTNPEYLKDCIESILGQTFTDFEFLILNDSPNNSEIEKIVKSYKDKRIKYYKNEKNMGISASRNKLLGLAKGEYIAIFDHDDISMPTRLEKQVNFLNDHKDIGVVGCNTLWIPDNIEKIYKTYNIDIKKALLHGCAVPHSGAMIRKSVMIDNNIGWEAEYSPAEDYMLWIRLLDKTMFHNIPEILLKYRFIEGNTSHLQEAKMQDHGMLIQCMAYHKFGFLDIINNRSYKTWIYLFSIIPVLKIKSYADSYKVYLFGFIPLFVNRIKEM